MLKSTALFLRKNYLAVILVAISIFVCAQNYTQNTYLTGWDTLHPEFNFRLYWSRVIDSVWQEHQGLGAVASQAHASEIPRVLILQLFSLFVGVSKLRYLYAFLMLVLGPLGIYFFLSKVLLKKFSAPELGAFVGGMFYLFNLGTLQHFYVPLEMFLTHYGLLGWVFLFATMLYESGRRRDLLLFLIASFFIIPQSHTPTLFYAYFGGLFLYVVTLAVADRSKEKTGRVVTILISTLLLNAFWFLPHLYFVFNHSAEISQSKIHHLFSEEAFLQNQEFGHVQDVALLKNFLFNWGEHVGEGKFGDLLDEWKLHLENPKVLYLGYIYFSIVVLGVLLSVISKNKYGFALCSLALFSLFFLLNNNPPFGWLFHYLQEHSALFKEVFRFPFTKFSIILMFVYASFFAHAVSSFSESVGRLFSKYKFISDLLIYTVVAFSFFYYARPALTGHLISPSMRVNIPTRYFDLFAYMDKQNEYGRVANLPIDSFWGWAYYDWNSFNHTGYQGAGFLWFGIKQPLLNREFDRWDILNEQYYREMSTAVYSQDAVALQNVLEKFKIKWILLDESVMAPGADEKALFYKQTKELLGKSSFISLEKDFGAGLSLYHYKPNVVINRQEIVDTFVYSNDSIFKENDDPIYKQYGNYASAQKPNYPYLGITNFDESLSDKVVSSDSQFVYFANNVSDAQLFTNETSVQFVVSSDIKSLVIKPVQTGIVAEIPAIEVPQGAEIAVINDSLPIILDSTPYTFSSATTDPIRIAFYKLNSLQGSKVASYASLIERCSGVEGGSSYGIEYTNGGFSLTAKDIVTCITMKLSSLTTSAPKLLAIKTDISESNSLAGICVFDELTGLCQNRPVSNGSAVALLEPSSSYLLRFLAYNVGKKTVSEGKVSFNNIQLLGGELISEKEVSVVRTQNFNAGDKIAFKKDPAYSGEAIKLLSTPRLCSGGESNFERSFVDTSSQSIEYTSNGESLCDSFQFPFVGHSTGSILEVTSRNLSGMPIRVCLTNEYSKRCDLYVSLGENKDFETAYYLIPPMDAGKGYTVNISNLVFGEGQSVNDLKYIALTPVPYNFFRSLHQEPAKSNNEKLLMLNDAYEVGWVAVCGYRLCPASHVMVNNWSNGWIFDGEIPSDLTVLFLPQLLQYLGFVLFPLAFFKLR